MASAPVTPPLMIVVYAYKMGHTIGLGATSRTTINLANDKERYFRLEEIAGSHPLTQYNIILDNPSNLGFQYAEGANALNRIYDLILAMNLALREVVFSPDTFTPIQYRWMIKERTSEEVGFILGMGQAEQLDEINVKKNLDNIYKLERHKRRKRITSQGYTRKANLVKALSQYELALYARGRRDIDIQSTFRTLSTAREIAHNWDKVLSVEDQDKELQKLAHVHIKTAEKWRKLYPRSKHYDESPQKQRRYRKLQNITSDEILSFRAAVNVLLLDRLGRL
ncbi:MAG TPA: hypothetical protein VFH28_05785 [Nitrososphaera sp.]|nr:hypothetical protein [Nitrososphaera sp.]